MKTKLFILSVMIISAALCGCESKTENISEDEINALIQGRQKIMTVTEYDCLPFDTSAKVSVDGTDYYAVNDESYNDWNEWTDYVKSIYCGEAAEAILSGDKIIEIDGKTYTNDGGKGNDLSEKYTFDIISETDSTAVITLKNTDNFTSEAVETEISLKKTSSGWRIAG